ncbi:PLP-dependent aminotransferase family protein [Cribrihabitans neustonicus]|uniref:MocR-like pyridoxine biosynthesis transcription factor PdxR n=1 Tax=Cribrihabitans neustonicus TaxID=1429085 RepID=UPI003B5B95C7
MVQLAEAITRIPRTGAKRIYLTLRKQILAGVYAAGEDIPSSRALAEELGVSRTTVTVAYEQLAAEGYISVRQGARPRVAVKAPLGPPGQDKQETAAGTRSAPLSSFGQKLLTAGPLPQPSRKGLVVNFRYGEMAPGDFPTSAWKRAVNAALLRRSPVLAYGEPAGSRRLRRALQGYLWRSRSLCCQLDQIIIVSGSQQALDLSARMLLDPTDAFVIENPAYAMARMAFTMTGARPVPIDVDSYGLDTARLSGVQARLAYVTPSHQYPLGGVMPIERRLELIEWSKQAGAWVIEDDYDSEYRYDVKPLPPLCSVDETGRVIYVGTISKILSPAMRIGYVVVPEGLREAFLTAKQLTDRHTSLLGQEALADLIESGAYERQVRRQRRLNAQRRAALIDSLQAAFGDAVEIEGGAAGLHVVVWFRRLPAAREGELIEQALRLGVGVYPVRGLCDPPLSSGRNAQIGLVMGYAAVDPEWIRHGVSLLRKAADQIA